MISGLMEASFITSYLCVEFIVFHNFFNLYFSNQISVNLQQTGKLAFIIDSNNLYSLK